MQKKSVGFELRILGNLIRREFQQQASNNATENLAGIHGWVIDYLIENQERDIFQRDFEEDFSIRRSTASKILQYLEKNNLIIRQSVAKDKRLKKIILTSQGKAMHKQLLLVFQKLEEKIIVGIKEEELISFYNTLDRMKQNLENEGDRKHD